MQNAKVCGSLALEEGDEIHVRIRVHTIHSTILPKYMLFLGYIAKLFFFCATYIRNTYTNTYTPATIIRAKF